MMLKVLMASTTCHSDGEPSRTAMARIHDSSTITKMRLMEDHTPTLMSTAPMMALKSPAGTPMMMRPIRECPDKSLCLLMVPMSSRTPIPSLPTISTLRSMSTQTALGHSTRLSTAGLPTHSASTTSGRVLMDPI